MERARHAPPRLLGRGSRADRYSEATDVLDLDGKVSPLRTVDASTSEARVGADGLR
jgi:hypothetical protein